MRLRRRILLLVGVVAILVVILPISYFAVQPRIVFEKDGQDGYGQNGCVTTSNDHGGGPLTLVAWDSRPRDAFEGGMAVRFPKNPYPSNPYVNNNIILEVFLKNAGTFPQDELPETRFGLIGNISSAHWYMQTNRVAVNQSSPFVVNTQDWYLLKFTVTYDGRADHHTFFVNGTQTLSMTVSPPYAVPFEKRTSFGVHLYGVFSYACFGAWYIRELMPSLIPSFISQASDARILDQCKPLVFTLNLNTRSESYLSGLRVVECSYGTVDSLSVAGCPFALAHA